MRDITKDTDRISRIWHWIYNNIPGEPARADEDVDDCVIRLLKEGQEAKRRLADEINPVSQT